LKLEIANGVFMDLRGANFWRRSGSDEPNTSMVEDSPDHLAVIYLTDDPQDALTFRTDQEIDFSTFSGTGSCFLDQSCPSIPGDIFISLRFEDAGGDGINFDSLL
jgi:hypothetical protein